MTTDIFIRTNKGFPPNLKWQNYFKIWLVISLLNSKEFDLSWICLFAWGQNIPLLLKQSLNVLLRMLLPYQKENLSQTSDPLQEWHCRLMVHHAYLLHTVTQDASHNHLSALREQPAGSLPGTHVHSHLGNREGGSRKWRGGGKEKWESLRSKLRLWILKPYVTSIMGLVITHNYPITSKAASADFRGSESNPSPHSWLALSFIWVLNQLKPY